MPAYRPQYESHADTIGGRQGTILRVTKLSDDGSVGTFRWAVTQNFPRIVVFDTSGTISINQIEVTTPFMTIAGQSAPSPGICIRGPGRFDLLHDAHDIVVQHMRFRVGDDPGGTGGGNRDCIISEEGQQIFDHCSITWGIDETYNIWITNGYPLGKWLFHKCIFSEGLDRSIHPQGRHAMGPLMRMMPDPAGHGLVFYRCMISSCGERMPKLRGSFSDGGTKGGAVFVNNIFYNKGNPSGFVQIDAAGINYVALIGNRFWDGPSEEFGAGNWVNVDTGAAGSETYRSDNTLNGAAYNPGVPNLVTVAPAWLPSPLTVLANADVDSDVLPDLGAWPLIRDVVDTRIVNSYINKTGPKTELGLGNFLVDSTAEVGGWPDLGANITDADPNKGPFNEGPNPNGDDGAGRTNVEVILEAMAVALEPEGGVVVPPIPPTTPLHHQGPFVDGQGLILG